MLILETPRLLLRRMHAGDADHLLEIFSDQIAMRYYPGTKNRTETLDWIAWCERNYEQYGIGLWLATLKATGEFAGQCGLVTQEVEGHPETEIGYLFVRRLWGRGLATEAARACRDYGFDQLGRERLVSLIVPDNLASRRVAEKNGLTLRREIVKWEKQVLVYAIDRPAASTQV
ncbi:MAG: GNAT family N-acetyltransferase [Herpetosiphon sp.]